MSVTGNVPCSNIGSDGTHLCWLCGWSCTHKFVFLTFKSVSMPVSAASTRVLYRSAWLQDQRYWSFVSEHFGPQQCWLRMRLFVFLHLSLSCCLRTRHLGFSHYLMNSQANSRSVSSLSRRSSAAKSSIAGNKTRRLRVCGSECEAGLGSV